MKFDAVIFDLDGTLLDTLQDIAESANRVMRARGFPAHETDKYRYFVGSGVITLMTKALPPENRHERTIADCAKAFREDYGRSWNVHTRLYQGVAGLLDALSQRRISMNVLSNKPHDFTKHCVQEFLHEWKFEIILGQRDGIPMKPDPAGAHEIARGLGVNPSAIIYLGDSGVDMTTAVNAGIFPVGVLWGFREEEELLEHGAALTIRSPMELVELLDTSNNSNSLSR